MDTTCMLQPLLQPLLPTAPSPASPASLLHPSASLLHPNDALADSLASGGLAVYIEAAKQRCSGTLMHTPDDLPLLVVYLAICNDAVCCNGLVYLCFYYLPKET